MSRLALHDSLRTVLAAGGVCLVLSGAGADDFRLRLESLIIPDRGEESVYTLVLGSNRFSFLPPPGWRVNTQPTNHSILLVPPDLSAGLSLTFRLQTNETAPDLTPQQYRQRVLERHPGASITGQFTCYVQGGKGLGFDLETLLDRQVHACIRAAYIAFQGGLLECELRANADRFPTHEETFHWLLSCLRIQRRSESG